MYNRAKVPFILFIFAFLVCGCECRWHSKLRVSGEPFTLEEIFGGRFSASGFGGSWISGTEVMYTNRVTGNVHVLDIPTNNDRILVNYEVIGAYNGTSYSLSPDGSFILIAYDRQAGFRHSSSSKFVLYDITNNVYSDVGGGNLIQLVTWAPSGNAVAFVQENNVYYRPLASDETEHQLTITGEPGIFYNGVPDWVYEEEVFGSGSALWFSPSGNRVAFAVFNDTLVREASYYMYGEPGSADSQYSQVITIKYPKPGTRNPDVSLKVVDLSTSISTGVIMEVDLPAPTDIVSLDHILYTVTWATDDEPVAIWTNRVQNVSVLTAYNLNTSPATSTTVLQKDEPDGWVSPVTPRFDEQGTRFVTILSHPQGPGEGDYNHVTLVERNANRATQTPLASGRYVATSVYGWDRRLGVIYFLGSREDKPTERHVWAAFEDGLSQPVCLSCSLLTPEGGECSYAAASFSRDLSHYALTCSGPDPATVLIYESSDPFYPVYTWETNEELRSRLSVKARPQLFNVQVPVDGGFLANVRLWLPPGLDIDGNVKYPLIVFVYAGPNSNQITDAFTASFGTYLATNRSIIYGMIDGRGSGRRGNSLLFSLNRKLGTVEIQDQISVAKSRLTANSHVGAVTILLKEGYWEGIVYLQQQYSFIDADRTGIWGWSYGGYATAMALAIDTEGVFKCGASVAPVTNWLYYDTIYTERYMGLPTPYDNEEGYNASDVTRRVDNFANKKFYLLHGNADDNVHYLQSMALARQLELADILFEQQSYPDENHSISGVVLHVYHSMDEFWRRCFQ